MVFSIIVSVAIEVHPFARVSSTVISSPFIRFVILVVAAAPFWNSPAEDLVNL